jgi:hypothetical protein
MKKLFRFYVLGIVLLTFQSIKAQLIVGATTVTTDPGNATFGSIPQFEKLNVGGNLALFNNGSSTNFKGFVDPNGSQPNTSFVLFSNNNAVNGSYLQFDVRNVSSPWSAGSISAVSYGVDGNSFSVSNFNPVTQTWSATPAMAIKKTGQIGIGTEWPDINYRLDVCGKIRCKELKVETGWCDYVFKPDYKLMPLEQLQVFLKEKYHLPEIPTEEDVVKNGSNVGNMQMLQMKKIEELTLYILQLHERIKKLEHRIGILNN